MLLTVVLKLKGFAWACLIGMEIRLSQSRDRKRAERPEDNSSSQRNKPLSTPVRKYAYSLSLSLERDCLVEVRASRLRVLQYRSILYWVRFSALSSLAFFLVLVRKQKPVREGVRCSLENLQLRAQSSTPLHNTALHSFSFSLVVFRVSAFSHHRLYSQVSRGVAQ